MDWSISRTGASKGPVLQKDRWIQKDSSFSNAGIRKEFDRISQGQYIRGPQVGR